MYAAFFNYLVHNFRLYLRLFGVSFFDNSVVEIRANGSFATLAHLPDVAPPPAGLQPDGLAIHPLTGRIYVAEPNTQRVFEVDLSGNISVFASDMEFDSGFFVSGMQFSADGRKLYYLSGDSSQSVRAIAGFPAVPEPISIAMAFVAIIIGLAAHRGVDPSRPVFKKALDLV